MGSFFSRCMDDDMTHQKFVDLYIKDITMRGLCTYRKTGLYVCPFCNKGIGTKQHFYACNTLYRLWYQEYQAGHSPPPYRE